MVAVLYALRKTEYRGSDVREGARYFSVSGRIEKGNVLTNFRSKERDYRTVDWFSIVEHLIASRIQ